jgi:hypothetical protein
MASLVIGCTGTYDILVDRIRTHRSTPPCLAADPRLFAGFALLLKA